MKGQLKISNNTCIVHLQASSVVDATCTAGGEEEGLGPNK